MKNLDSKTQYFRLNYYCFIAQLILLLTTNVILAQTNNFKRFIVTSNSSGVLSSPIMGTFAFNGNGFPTLDGLPSNGINDRPQAGQQSSNNSLWGIATGCISPTMDPSYSFFLNRVTYGGANWPNIGSYDYEIRFTSTGSRGLMAYTSGLAVQLPFEIWNIGNGTPNDPSDDYELIAWINDVNANNVFDLDKVDHVVSSNDDDPETDWIYIYDVTDHTPGKSGYNQVINSGFISGIGNLIMGRLTLVSWEGGSVTAPIWPNNLIATMPEVGTVFRIETVKTIPQTCISPPQGMVGWWAGDKNANDISGYNNNGNLHGSVSYAIGKVDDAFILNSQTDYIEVVNNQSLNFAMQNFSIDAWIKTTQIDRATIVDKRTGTTSNPVGYTLFISSGMLGFQLGDGSPTINHMSAGPAINDGAWHFVSVTIDRSSVKGGNLYIDGVLNLIFDPTIQPGNISNTANLWIGQHQISSAQTYHAFKGSIDEVEIFNRVLSSGEIYSIFLADYHGKCKTLTTVSDDNIKVLPKEFSLSQNYPNPFNPTTTISYQIPVAGYVSLKIYDMLGREVTTLVNEFQNPGYYAKTFDGSSLSSGTYFYRLQTGKYYETHKLLILK